VCINSIIGAWLTQYAPVKICLFPRDYRLFRVAYCLCHQALMMEAVRTSETSIYFHDTTRRYIAESCHIQNNICQPGRSCAKDLRKNEDDSIGGETCRALKGCNFVNCSLMVMFNQSEKYLNIIFICLTYVIKWLVFKDLNSVVGTGRAASGTELDVLLKVSDNHAANDSQPADLSHWKLTALLRRNLYFCTSHGGRCS
jgi:hypothetical protein